MCVRLVTLAVRRKGNEMITSEQIEKLASRKGAKRIAVENFLGTLGTMSRADALGNLDADARAYRWNAATVNAIRAGILASVS